jgi:WD40 repeat protein
MRGVLAFFTLVLMALAAPAQSPPESRPILRIEAGMHIAAIRGIDVDASGKLLATASDDKTARLWSLPEGELLRTFRVPIDSGDGGNLYAVAISPDGKTVAAAGFDFQAVQNGKGLRVYLFDTASGNILQRLGPTPDIVNALAFSPDGTRLAAGISNTGGLMAWTAPFDGPAFADRSYGKGLLGLDFDAENHLFTAAQDGTIRHYGPDFKLLAGVTTEGAAPLHKIAVSPDGKLVAVGYLGKARIDVLDSGSLKRLYSPNTSGLDTGDVSSVAWSADGKKLYGAGNYYQKDETYPAFVWDRKGKGKRRALGREGANYMDLVPLPSGGVAFASASPSFGFLDPETLWKDRVSADMRDKLEHRFLISPDGAAARFSFDAWDKGSWTFDAAALSFKPAEARPPGFIAPETGLLPVMDWMDSRAPSLAGAPFSMDQLGMSRSLAIAHSAKSFVLGGNFAISKYDKDGGLIWWRGSPTTTWGVNLSADDEVLVTASGDGTLRWYRANDGEELLAFFAHRASTRWIAWTPSGYYAASPGAEDFIGWHVNGRTDDDTPAFYPASRFRDQFYRPDIVQLVLKLRSEKQAIEEANARAGVKDAGQDIDALLPATVAFLGESLSLETAKPEVTVRYEIQSPTGRPVTRVEARIDGRPVSTRGAVEVRDDYPPGTPLDITVDVPPRDSELSLVAFIGDHPGVAQRIKIKWTGAKQAEKRPRLFALLVGVSAYKNPDLRLAFAAKDARDFAESLRAQDGALYQSVDIETLADADASKPAIETALLKLRKKAGPDDLTIVFLAGHGVTDAAQDFYYLGADAELDDDLLAATAVSGETIRKGLARVPGRVVLFMDTCHSGDGVTSRADMSRATNELAEESAGLVMFASSQGREVSFERSDWQNGAFTEALLAIVADDRLYGEDRKLSIPELEEAVTTKVSELTEGRQNAGMTKYGAVPRFFIAALK